MEGPSDSAGERKIAKFYLVTFSALSPELPIAFILIDPANENLVTREIIRDQLLTAVEKSDGWNEHGERAGRGGKVNRT